MKKDLVQVFEKILIIKFKENINKEVRKLLQILKRKFTIIIRNLNQKITKVENKTLIKQISNKGQMIKKPLINKIEIKKIKVIMSDDFYFILITVK